MFGFMVLRGSKMCLEYFVGTTAGNITVTMVVVRVGWFAYNHSPAAGGDMPPDKSSLDSVTVAWPTQSRATA